MADTGWPSWPDFYQASEIATDLQTNLYILFHPGHHITAADHYTTEHTVLFGPTTGPDSSTYEQGKDNQDPLRMKAHTPAPAKRAASPLLGLIASVVFVMLLLAILLYFGVHYYIIDLLHWVDAQGIWGPVLLVLLMALVVVLVLPGVLLTTGAGFVFGVVEGSVYIVLGTTLGALAAFLIARYLFGPYAVDFVRRRNRLRLINEEMSANGWKIVLLTRLIPFFPGKLSNYFFGLTRFSWQGYLVGSLIGFIPFSVHNVYLGSIAADVTTLGLRNTERTGFEWILYGGGFVMTVIIVFYLNRLARRALSQYTKPADNEESES